MIRTQRSSSARGSFFNLLFCLVCGTAPLLSGCAGQETADDLPGDAASCALPDGFEVLSSGNIVRGDIIVGNEKAFKEACAAGEEYPLDGRPRSYAAASDEDDEPGLEPASIGVSLQSLKWPSGVVYYKIDSGLPQEARVYEAMAEWETKTSIMFLERTSQTDYVIFRNGARCVSAIGRQGGPQDIELTTGKATTNIVGSSTAKGDLGVPLDNQTFTWYDDGMVSGGTSTDLHGLKAQFPYKLPPGRVPSQIRGIAASKSSDAVFAWYSDGTVSKGRIDDLDAYTAPQAFSLPPGKAISDIVEMDLGPLDRIYTWFDDGTFTIGTSTDLDAFQGATAYTLPSGQSTSGIVGISFSLVTGQVYAWYTNGKVSVGSTSDFDSVAAPTAYSTPGHCDTPAVIHEIGHALGLLHEQSRSDRDDHVRVFEDNIIPGKEPNFKIVNGWGVSNMGSYNTKSIMHYDSYGFSRNDRPTILGLVTAGAPLLASSVIDMAISSNDTVYTWWSDGKVMSGSASDLESVRSRYTYTPAPGYTPSDIVGIGIAKSTDRVYTWYKDGKVSVGNSADLDAHTAPYSYSLPPGYLPTDILAIDISTNDHVYAWYKDGKVSSGTSADLDQYMTVQNYSLAAGRNANQVGGIAIATSGWVWTWHSTGRVSAGTFMDLDAHVPEFDFMSRLGLIESATELDAGDIATIEAMY